MSDNCDYHGRLYYNSEMWYSQDCQHCACSYGRVLCMNVECESTFCLKDEVVVRHKDSCCIECRQPTQCRLLLSNSSEMKIRENEFWTSPTALQKNSPKACRICQCGSDGQLVCYSKSCQTAKHASFAHLRLVFGEKKLLNAKTIPFLADFIKSFDRKAMVFVTSGPKVAKIFAADQNRVGNYFRFQSLIARINFFFF